MIFFVLAQTQIGKFYIFFKGHWTSITYIFLCLILQGILNQTNTEIFS